MSEGLDFSKLDKIPPELEESLSPGWRRVLRALRRLKAAKNREEDRAL